MDMTVIVNLIEKEIADETARIKEHNEILEILTPLIGKEINKRTLNPKRVGRFEVNVDRNKLSLIGEYQHDIGYTGHDIDLVVFKSNDTMNSIAAHARIDKLNSLDVDKVHNYFSIIEHHFNELRYVFGDIERENLSSFSNPIYHDLIKLIHDTKHSHYDIDLNNFSFIKLFR